MPATVHKSPKGGYDIVNKSTGKKYGHSDTKAKAQKSANARNAGSHGWRPGKRGR